MTSGRIDVAGSAGRHVGSQMSGGEIDVAGSAGDWLGAEMHGGSIRVRGDAGNLVGGAVSWQPARDDRRLDRGRRQRWP